MSRPLPLDLLNLSIQAIPEAMSSPPTITRGVDNANSTVVTTATTSTATILPSSTKLTWAHGTAVPISFPAMYWTANTINYGGGTRTGNYISVRFMTDAPEFDFALGNRGSKLMLWADGQPMSRAAPYVTPSNSAYAYHKASFGADTLTYMLEAATITAGGSGYAIGDVVTLAGGTFTAAAQVYVSAVSAGVVTGVLPIAGGNYSVVPSTPVAQDTTTGSGTGLTITPVWGQRHTTRKWRRIEIMMSGNSYFGGINVPAGCTVLPWPVSGEKWLAVGDSITENAYNFALPSTWDEVLFQSLGVFDASVSYGIGSVGYVEVNGSRPNFLGMVPDLVALAPTRMVIGLGINDANTQTAAAIQANVATAFGQLVAQLPNCLFFCLGPWSGRNGSLTGTLLTASNAIKAGFEAVVPASRGVFCDTTIGDQLIKPDNTSAPSTPGTGNTGHITSSDATHPSSYGHEYLGYGAANAIVRGSRSILAAA